MRRIALALAHAILRTALPPDSAETISGDLEEMLHDVARRRGRTIAAAWLLREVASIVWARLIAAAAEAGGTRARRKPMAALQQDLLYAVRSLGRQPGFSLTVVLMLALGMGANVAIFSLVHAVLFKPLPFAEPERLMMVHMTAPDFEDPAVVRRMIWSYPKYLVFREHQQVFDTTALFSASSWNITGTGSPERAIGEFVESTYFDALGIAAVAGRTFTAEETRSPGSSPLVLVGHGFWERRFGGDPGALGTTIGLDGVGHTIVGVLPRGFRGLTGQAEIWVPVMSQPHDVLAEKWNHAYSVIARRKPGAPIATAQSAVTLLGEIVANAIPDPKGRPSRGGALAVLLNDDRADPLMRRSLLLLLVAVASVLLLVCLNVANLTFARALARQREVAIRLAVGASRLRIVRQFMTESVLLAVVSAAAGLAVAWALVSAGASMMPDLRMVLPPRSQSSGLTRAGLGAMGFDAAVLAFAFALTLVTATLFGLAPAWRVSRRDLTDAMKRGAAGDVSPGTRGAAMRNVMVAFEIALALVLLAAGGLMLKSVLKLQETELGFDPRALLSARVAPVRSAYTPARATQFFDEVVTRLAARPEVEAAAYGSCAPVSGGCNGTTITLLDRAQDPETQKPPVGVMWASPGYFETLDIRLIRGRSFTARDRAGQPKVVLLNEAAARAFWGTRDPVGSRIAVGQGGFGDGAEVIGVVADVRYEAVERSVAPGVYIPLLQSPRSSGALFVRGQASTAALAAAVGAEVHALEPDLPLTDVRMMRERVGDSTWRTRIGAWLLGLFATVALLLAALGVYGVMSQAVQQRAREIGVRIALGAARADILRLVIGRVARIAAAGIALGVVLAVPSTRLLTALLYDVRPGDPVVIGTLALLLLSVAIVAGYLPARRAARVDPLTTLRAE